MGTGTRRDKRQQVANHLIMTEVEEKVQLERSWVKVLRRGHHERG